VSGGHMGGGWGKGLWRRTCACCATSSAGVPSASARRARPMLQRSMTQASGAPLASSSSARVTYHWPSSSARHCVASADVAGEGAWRSLQSRARFWKVPRREGSSGW
jgi:hypothetical protein